MSTSISLIGDRLQSQGTLATDKKFTGQRLDGTGLYYYGARYYDCTIGRFVSPDTVVQDYTNPQTLNRYSYVLNNPLKYVDPTGHEVEFENEELALQYLNDPYSQPDTDTWKIIQDWAALRCGWYLLSTAALDLTGYLERAPEKVTIGFGNGNGKWGGVTTSDGMSITIDNSDFVKSDSSIIAAILGHEAVHSAYKLTLQPSHVFRSQLSGISLLYDPL